MDLGTTEAKTKKKTKILNLCEQSIAKHNTYIKRLKKKNTHVNCHLIKISKRYL